MDHKYKSLLQNIPTRHMIVKADLKDGKEQLKRLRERDIFNYFIVGRISTIKNVLDSAEENEFFERQFAWHGITSVSIMLRMASLLQIMRKLSAKSTRNESKWGMLRPSVCALDVTSTVLLYTSILNDPNYTSRVKHSGILSFWTLSFFW
jgi:hypothetical protein